jgi:chromosome partitioning protein
MATIIALVNQKGGCGKSSTCFHLAGAMAAAGRRVLLVDADPQGSLSQAFFGSHFVETLEAGQTLAAAFTTTCFVNAAELTLRTPIEGISIIPANHHLARFNTPEPENLGLGQFAIDALLSKQLDADELLIDCPPNLYACTWNALLAADRVVIPVPPEDFGTQGLRAVQQAIEAGRGLNPRLGLLGHLVTRYDGRMLVHRAYDQKLRSLYGDAVLDAIVPEASAFKVALACRTPVTHFSPRSKATLAITALRDEVATRAKTAYHNQQVA